MGKSNTVRSISTRLGLYLGKLMEQYLFGLKGSMRRIPLSLEALVAGNKDG